jgi:hypothetical protein
MPIRINLLAEQKEEEELRRRDPVKRAIWGAGVLVALAILGAVQLQFKVVQAKNELAGAESSWSHLERQYIAVSNNWSELRSIESRLASLDRYATSRFLWTEPLNALQFASVENVRLVKLDGTQIFTETKLARFETNLNFELPPRSWWKFWGEKPSTNIHDSVNRVLGAVTNNTNFARFQPLLTTTVTASTSSVRIVAKINVSKPESVTERITVRVQARDYSDVPSQQVDSFYEAFTNTPYFRRFLPTRAHSSIQPEAISRQQDPNDLINPTGSYMPFILEARFPERTRAHE